MQAVRRCVGSALAGSRWKAAAAGLCVGGVLMLWELAANYRGFGLRRYLRVALVLAAQQGGTDSPSLIRHRTASPAVMGSIGIPLGSFCAQLAAGTDSAVPSAPSLPNSTRITRMAATPRGKCTRTRIAGVSTRLSTKARTIGKMISAAT